MCTLDNCGSLGTKKCLRWHYVTTSVKKKNVHCSRICHSPYLIIFLISKVYCRAVGGEVPATSSLAPKIGPLGLVRKLFNHCMTA